MAGEGTVSEKQPACTPSTIIMTPRVITDYRQFPGEVLVNLPPELSLPCRTPTTPIVHASTPTGSALLRNTAPPSLDKGMYQVLGSLPHCRDYRIRKLRPELYRKST